MAYYTLVTRETRTSSWTIQFGDHDKDTVVWERADTYQRDHLMGNMKIIKTKSARQSEIDKAIAELNAKAVQ